MTMHASGQSIRSMLKAKTLYLRRGCLEQLELAKVRTLGQLAETTEGQLRELGVDDSDLYILKKILRDRGIASELLLVRRSA